MHTRKPLFPGNNTQHQLDLIISLLGAPGEEELQKIPNEKCRKFIQAFPRTAGTPFHVAFPEMSSEVHDLLTKMMCWDPAGRLTVAEALQEPVFENLHCPEDEPVREPLDTSDFEFERRRITPAALREEIFRESLFYYPDLLEQFEQDRDSRCDISKCRLLVPGESQYSSDEEDEGGT
uniref:Protein kinase domain-containing protein n=1 Tax=Alexandrium monilatum TaxID=311494 RepID=A0A7S4SHQ3_9DINO